MAILEKNISSVTYDDTCKVLTRRRYMEHGDDIEPLPRLEYLAKNVVFVLSDFTFVYFIFYFTCSLVGLVAEIPILYTISLFEIIVSYSHFDPI